MEGLAGEGASLRHIEGGLSYNCSNAHRLPITPVIDRMGTCPTILHTIGTMSKVRVACFSLSLDGFGAGPRQDLENPLGVRGPEIFSWFFQTEVFQKMQGESGGSTGIDNQIAAQSFENVGAFILGRNMFGPVRVRGRTIPGRLVGRYSSVSHAGLCAHPSPARFPFHERRHHVPLRDRRHRVCFAAGQSVSEWQRRPDRWRRVCHPPISACRTD